MINMLPSVNMELDRGLLYNSGYAVIVRKHTARWDGDHNYTEITVLSIPYTAQVGVFISDGSLRSSPRIQGHLEGSACPASAPKDFLPRLQP